MHLPVSLALALVAAAGLPFPPSVHARAHHDLHPEHHHGAWRRNNDLDLYRHLQVPRTVEAAHPYLLERGSAAAPTSGTVASAIFNTTDVGFLNQKGYDGDCDCECAAFDDMINQCLSGSSVEQCTCNDNMFGEFITCAMCDPTYYESQTGGLEGFVNDAIAECKTAGFTSLNVDVSGLPSKSNVTSSVTSRTSLTSSSSTQGVFVPATNGNSNNALLTGAAGSTAGSKSNTNTTNTSTTVGFGVGLGNGACSSFSRGGSVLGVIVGLVGAMVMIA